MVVVEPRGDHTDKDPTHINIVTRGGSWKDQDLGDECGITNFVLRLFE